MLLNDLATKYGTDKGIWGYLPHYARELEHRRDSVKRVLEIGICGQRDIPNNVTGASLWMWHDYFPTAHVHGIDIDPRWMLQRERITSYVGDQGNPASLAEIAQKAGGSFDLIVDDAVHDPEIQLTALRALLPFLAPDGLYAIEDVCPYKLPGGDITKMTSQIPDGYSCEVIHTHKPEVMLFVKRQGADARSASWRAVNEDGTLAPEAVTVTVGHAPLLLGLCMIVKNEAKRIAEVLRSFKPAIDRWTILDTGSEDGTQDIIRAELADIPGELHEEPFVDFATSRNRALALHGTSTVFVVMPNGDILQGALALRGFLDARRAGLPTAYRVRIAPGHYFHPLVMRTGCGWHYEGRTHECLMGEGAGAAIDGVQLLRDRSGRTDDEWKARWQRDIVLLRRDAAENPTNPRPYFYLGQTYDCLGKHEEALGFYGKRAAMGGYFDERFEAKLRIAKMRVALDRPWDQVMNAYLDAYAFDPRRAEPLCYIAEHYHKMNNHPLTYLFASRAAALPPPPTDLFLDEAVYAHRAADLAAISAYYTPSVSRDEGRAYAERAVRARPTDERIRANHAFYARSAREMFGATSQTIEFAPEAPYTASTPSILQTPSGWRCIVRAVNYRIVDGRYIMPQGDPKIRTRNFMLELEHDLDTGIFVTTRTVEIVDRADRPRTDYVIAGYEDCRLFSYQGKLYATATACDLTDEGLREIVLCHLSDSDYAIEKVVPLRGPWSCMPQKNWMPIETAAPPMCAFYSAHPAMIFEIDPDVGVIGMAKRPDTLGCGRLRGGSQAIDFEDIHRGRLYLVHDVAFPGSGRMYLHRFCRTDADGQIVAMTDPFYFEKLGIEFAAGLAFDPGRGGAHRLVASYSVGDASAQLATFDLARVLSAMKTDYVP